MVIPSAVFLALVMFGTPEDDRAAAELHLKNGAEAARTERYDEAIAEFKAVVALVPSANALYNLAQCYEATNRDREAVEVFNQLIHDLEISAPLDAEGTRLLEAARKRLATAKGRLAEAPPSERPQQPPAAAAAPLPLAPRPHSLVPEFHPPATESNRLLGDGPPAVTGGKGLWDTKKWWIIGASAVVAGSVTVFLITRSASGGNKTGPGPCPAEAELGLRC